MSNQINPNIKPYSQVPMGISSTAVNSTALPNVDTDKIQKDVNGNPLVKNANADNPLVMGGTMLATWGALIALMNKINDGCKTKDGTSVLHKLKNFGNRINNKIVGHDFFKSKTFEKMKGWTARAREFWNTKIVEKSDFLKTLFRTPTVPKNSQVLMMEKGTQAEVATAAAQFFDKYVQGPVIKGKEFLHGKDPEKLHKLGLVKDPANPTQEEILEFERLVKNPNNKVDIERIMQICEKNAAESFEVSKGLKIPFTNKYLSDYLPFTEKMFKREIHFSEFANKLRVLTESDATAKGLGKFLPKAYLRNIQAITFGLDGSKFGMFMQAFFLTSTFMQTAKAEKGDKFKTFMENFFSNQAMYLTMALSIRWMHKFGGLRYLPLKGDATKLEAYRKSLEEFDKKANTSSLIKKGETLEKAKARLHAKVEGKRYRIPFTEIYLSDHLPLKKEFKPEDCIDLQNKVNAAEDDLAKAEAEREEIGFFESEGEFKAARKLLQLQEKGLEIKDVDAMKQAIAEHGKMLKGSADSSAIEKSEKALMARLTELEHGLRSENTLKGGLKEAVFAPFRWAAKILTVGLEPKSRFVPKDISCMKSRLVNWRYYMSKGAGYPVRFIFFGFVIAPFFSKLAARGSHLIFGRPKHSTILDEEEPKDEKPAEHKLPAPVRGQPGFPIQSQHPAPAAPIKPVAQPNTPVTPAASTNNTVAAPAKPAAQTVAQPVAHPAAQPAAQPVTQAYNLNMPAQQRQVINPAPVNQNSMIASQEPVRTYIPSPVGVKIDHRKEQQENQQANAAMLKSVKAEKMVSHVLGE